MAKQDLKLISGDCVEYMTTLPGLSGGSCRSLEKVIERVDEGADRVHFTDGTTYHHIENTGMTLKLIVGTKRP